MLPPILHALPGVWKRCKLRISQVSVVSMHELAKSQFQILNNTCDCQFTVECVSEIIVKICQYLIGYRYMYDKKLGGLFVTDSSKNSVHECVALGHHTK